MRGYKWYVVVFFVFLVIIQPSLSKWFSISGAVVNFVLFFIILTAFEKKQPDIFIVPIAIGFFYDMLYSPWLGRMTIVFVLAIVTVLVVERIVFKENMPVFTLFFFTATYFLENIRAFIEVGPAVYTAGFVFIQGTILKISLYAAALAGIFGIIYYLISLFNDRKLGARKRGII